MKSVHVVTSTGAPWWVTELIMRNPVRRQLRMGVVVFCARGARFRMLSLYNLDKADRSKCARFVDRVRRNFAAV